LRAVRVRTDERGRMLLCEIDGFIGNMGPILFTTKGNPTLKYINEVIDHILGTEIYIQIKERCVHSVKMAKESL